MGTVLGGTLILVVIIYIAAISLLAMKAYRGHLESNSEGTANLKFQEWNPAWQKYVTRRRYR